MLLDQDLFQLALLTNFTDKTAFCPTHDIYHPEHVKMLHRRHIIHQYVLLRTISDRIHGAFVIVVVPPLQVDAAVRRLVHSCEARFPLAIKRYAQVNK